MTESVAWQLFTDSIQDVSVELGHNLDYTLKWGRGRALSQAGTPGHSDGKQDIVFSVQRISKSIMAVRGFEGATLDLRRQEIIAQGKPLDHYNDIVVTRNPGFELDTTIFRSVTSWMNRQYLEAALNTQLFWHDRAIERIQHEFVNVPRPPEVSRQLLAFMKDECQFAMERADSSALDHLLFGYEYSVAHYQEQSPRVMLLHSIMGVDTNLFPMKADQIERLKSFLNANEFMHIQAFPSVLRLLYHGKLLPELLASEDILRLEEISFQRVMAPHIDLKMSAEDFFVQLNFQLMHLVDFLPASNWNDPVVMTDPHLKLFQDLRQLLQKSSRLAAQVGFDAPTKGGPVGSFPEPTVGSAMPESLSLQLFRDSVEKFSRELGHSLSYKLIYSRE